jgi:MFS family permease
LAFAAVNSFIVLYAESRGISGTALFFTCMAVAMCLTRLFSGRLTDTFGEIPVALPCLLATIAGFLLLIWTHSSLVFYAVGFLLGLSTGTVNPVLQAAAVKASPTNRRGAANGTFQLANDLANGLGAVLWGLTIDAFGYTCTFIGCILCVAISIGLLLIFFLKRE